MATRTQSVLGERGRRIRELTSVVQKRFGFAEGSVEVCSCIRIFSRSTVLSLSRLQCERKRRRKIKVCESFISLPEHAQVFRTFLKRHMGTWTEQQFLQTEICQRF